MRPYAYLPTRSNSFEDAFCLNFLYRSMVKSVELELKMEVRSDMSAASITEIMIPRIPSGMMPSTSLG